MKTLNCKCIVFKCTARDFTSDRREGILKEKIEVIRAKFESILD
jgi:hypothetical protein